MASLEIEEEVKPKPLSKKGNSKRVQFEMRPLSLQEAPEDKIPVAKEVTTVSMDAAHKLLTQEEDNYKVMTFKKEHKENNINTVTTISDAALTDYCQRRKIEDLNNKLVDMRIFWEVFIFQMCSIVC